MLKGKKKGNNLIDKAITVKQKMNVNASGQWILFCVSNIQVLFNSIEICS